MDFRRETEQMEYKASIGSMMVGLLLAAFLGGMASLQTALYFASSKGDYWAHRLSVTALWVLAIVQLSFIFHATYFYAITEGVDDPGRTPFIWSFKLQIFMLTIFMSATKVLYTVRIWNLLKEKKKWIPIVLSALLVVEYALGTLFAIKVTSLTQLVEVRFVNFKYSVFLAMGFNTFTDILVAAALIYTIVKSDPNLKWTSSSYTMLLAYILNTGAVASVFSVLALIGFAIGVTNPIYIISEMVLPQLYVNCFFSMINASYYFQTKSSLDISISYRSQRHSNSYVLSISRMGSHGDPESLLHRTSGSLGSEADFSNLTLVKGPGTINEVGFPLFERDGNRTPEIPGLKTPPLEVQVETTQTEYTIDRRMLQDARYQTAMVETGKTRR